MNAEFFEIRRAALGLAPLFVLCVAFALRPAFADAPTEAPRDREIHGIVKDKQGRGLGWVSIEVLDRSRRTIGSTLSGEDGRFAFEKLPADPVTIEASIFGVPLGRPGVELEKSVTAGSTDLVLVLDRGTELLLKCDGGAFVPELDSYSKTPKFAAKLVIETPAGPLTYWAGFDAGRATFRRIKTGLPWTLWIPWRSTMNGTRFETGTRLEGGERTVSLEPGKLITCSVTADPERHNGPPQPGSINWERAFASRGPIEVAGAMGEKGELEFPLLASGRWVVTARIYDRKKGGILQASAEVEAGGPAFVLSPVPRPK